MDAKSMTARGRESTVMLLLLLLLLTYVDMSIKIR
jgi:hypothetical protein